MYIVWVYFDGRFYSVGGVYSSWENANQYCKTLENKNPRYTTEIRSPYYLDFEVFPVDVM